MPKRFQKFGIKIWLAVDVKTKYIIKDFPYLRKDEIRSSISLGQYVVLKLAESYLRRVRNINTDNFFTSVPFSNVLLAQKTTLVGTTRVNKRELSNEVKASKDKMTVYYY